MAASGESTPPDAERDPRPVVRRPSAGLPGAAIAAIAAFLAILLFVILNERRQQPLPKTAVDTANSFPAPPQLTLPPDLQPRLEPLPAIVPQPVPVAPPRMPPMAPLSIVPTIPVSPPLTAPGRPALPDRSASRAGEVALVFDNGPTDGRPGAANAAALTPGGATGGATAASGDDTPVRTTVIRNKTTIMPVGTVIPAVLETPIDSARPGLVRAIVSEDARGFDGKQVLVPRGSRLIGEYQSDVQSGQNRVLVTWTRLVRPDGVAIRIGSPAADALGGSGIPGRVNTFFFQKFASAVLQSALTIGVNLASRPGRGSVIVGVPASNVGAIGQGLLPSGDLKPKIKVKQGAILTIFVARDLDFSGAPYRADDAR